MLPYHYLLKPTLLSDKTEVPTSLFRAIHNKP
jgi:hypothetical protein